MTNNYIIDPSWFYWIGIVHAAKIVFIALAVIVGAILLYNGVNMLENHELYGKDDSDFKKYKRYTIISGAAFIVALLGVIFIPSKNTLIMMQIAKYATYENAEWTVETIRSAVDYIVKAVNSIK